MDIVNRICLTCFYSCLANCNLKARKGKRLCFVNHNIVTKEGAKVEVDKNGSCSKHKFEFEINATRE